MALLTYADRVAETSTMTGTGDITLLGALDGKFRTFVAGAGSGNTVPYVIVHRTANEWESGYGVVTAGSPNKITRGGAGTGVYASTNSNTAVNFSAGTKDVFLALPGSKTVRFEAGNTDVSFAGNVGIGTATPDVFSRFYSGTIVGISSSAGQSAFGINSATGNSAYLDLGVNGTRTCSLFSDASSAELASVGAIPLTFSTNNTERARITAGGYLKASNDGTYFGSGDAYHEMRGAGAGLPVAVFTNTNASTPDGLYLGFTAAAPDDNSRYFLHCLDNVTSRLFIYSDGDVLNHDGVYGTISDAKLKQDITDAGSQWDDLKAIRFRKYRFISDVEAKGEDAPTLLGVVAQELQATSPGLVDSHPDTEQVEVEVEVEKSRPVLDEDGEPMLDEDGAPLTETYTETETRTETRPTGTETLSVKSSILLMKAAKALQEAMARIESLEARLAALENA